MEPRVFDLRAYSRRPFLLGLVTGAVTLLLDLVPVAETAVRRHPELQRAWILGGRRSWRV